ncbi:metal-dependent hydrolase [Paraglaciecola sp.]|uniref:metal-dependent hydrolase n=1 Tax=Paraglaciecola sp. TaxID=1920173 RepID=UPI003267F96E
MASTLGHALSGVDCLLIGRLVCPNLIGKISVSGIIFIAFLANVPDLDLLVGPMLGKHHHFLHGQMTHSISFSVMWGLLMWLGAKVIGADGVKCKTAFIFGFAGIFSHVVVDWFTGPNPGVHPSFGTMILWPFSWERIHAPFTLFLGPHHGSLEEFLSLHNLWVMVREFLIFGGVAGVLIACSASLREEIITMWRDLLKKYLK